MPTTTPKTASPGKIGGKYAAGEVVLTATGRQTTPFPKVDTANNQRTKNTLKRVAT